MPERNRPLNESYLGAGHDGDPAATPAAGGPWELSGEPKMDPGVRELLDAFLAAVPDPAADPARRREALAVIFRLGDGGARGPMDLDRTDPRSDSTKPRSP